MIRSCAQRLELDHLAPHDLRRTCAKLFHVNGGELEQIQFLLGHASVLTTERYLGCKQTAASPASAFALALDHAATEDMLARSGVPWTAPRNGFFADSAAMFMGREWQQGKIIAPADGKVSWAAHSDLAAAAAAIVTGVRTFDGPTPPLTGTESLDLTDLGSIGSSLIGLPIAREIVTDEAFRKQAKQWGLPESLMRILICYYEASRRGEFSSLNGTLEALTGRPTKPMRDVLKEVIKPMAETS